MARSDVIVLGAGIVGISAALHLQGRGRSVALVDRRGMAEETSFGNTGIRPMMSGISRSLPWNTNRIARSPMRSVKVPRVSPI